MKQENIPKTIPVQIIVRESCKACDKVVIKLASYSQHGGNIKVDIFNVDINDQVPKNRQGFITPAVWVNDQLWYYGDFDLYEFHKKIETIIKEPKCGVLT
jgi:alkyl hydroperoxide reductase subunit AhpF